MTPARKIILSLTISLDGFIEGPEGQIDWITADNETWDDLLEFAGEIDTVLYGRKSYELYGNYHPDDAAEEKMKRFYHAVNRMKKYVVSTTMQSDALATVISGNLLAAVDEIRNQNGKHIWLFGGSDLITTFVNNNLIDEYRIAVQPVIIGSGNPLFKNITQYVHLDPAGTRTGKSGVTELRYTRKQPARDTPQ